MVVLKARDADAARASLRIALKKVVSSFDKDGSQQLDKVTASWRRRRNEAVQIPFGRMKS